ncbi:putative membrane protein [Clostridium bornimense]|uniref:Putative membrane protein n=1 Tax=Clostridium bornimense TaxID=1216932 RepID=W6SH26_9CLOT|nr:FtsX-like permease family protein [Clostridium bornimense]CDM68970.1 putative membrane protein [Clostridium bornimense]
MTYFKLALGNVKKSFKEYTIYFLTLLFGVCIFYTFNSIESQKIMMDIGEYQASIFEMVGKVMSVASVFIAGVLGFLIVYANNYLIKRRKKELGIYMTLGMEKGSIGRILFLETVFIGLISLVLGSILGIFLSQGLSVLTAKLFQVNLTKFQFVFSMEALKKTILYFAIIYSIVLIFNSVTLRKVKLIDLLTAAKKNETLKTKNIMISVIIFIISVIMIGYGYHRILSNGIAELDGNFSLTILIGVVGTFLFFFSLSGFLLRLVQSNKRIYLKNLNMFVLRQINSKINTTFISMSFICLMLFVAICTLSGGLGMSKSMNSDMKDLTKVDATIYSFEGVNIEEAIKEKGFNIDEFSNDYVNYQLYDSNVGLKDYLGEEESNKAKSLYPVMNNSSMRVIKLSHFNKILDMLGEENVVLNDNEYAIYSNVSETKSGLEKALKSNKEITINDKKLVPSKLELMDITINNEMVKNNCGIFIIKDSLVEGLEIKEGWLVLNYKDNNGDIENNFSKFIDDAIEDDNNIFSITKEKLLASSVGFGAMLSFLAIYIGVIFLLTTAAILAIQQLSESADNVAKYNLLRKIGVDNNMINRSLLVQIAIYFMVPLSLAIVHSIVGLKVSSDIVSLFGSESMMTQIIISIVLLVVVYGGYFLATYLGAKKMVKENKI